MSILPDFEYDIFISYRHNDNRPSAGSGGWVTEFVKALQEELAATIKEPLTIYFDKNPHDGLLETHHVDKSLEGKLKCLIFIPIISQTYCDPKSFAWQHEFCAFNKLAKEDQFGRDIKLRNGNVASRILPIKIHDLDVEDKAIIENEMAGVLRAIEFIYKESGVNRPLAADDSEEKNLARTKYKNQVNKVANAIKEIITAIKNPETASRSANSIKHSNPTPKSTKKYVLPILLLLAVLVASYFLYPKIFSPSKELEAQGKSIAVLPFVNMSGDSEQEYFSDGLSEELLNLLSKVEGLKVIARTSSFSFKGKNDDVRNIGKQLDVAYLLEGSVRKSGQSIRITAQLVSTTDGSHLWSNTYDRELKEIFSIQDEIANAITTQLRLEIPGLGAKSTRPRNIEAYNLILEANFIQRQSGSPTTIIELMEQAVALDSNDATLWARLAYAYNVWGNNATIRTERFRKARSYAEKAVAIDPNNAYAHRILGTIYRTYYWDWSAAQREFDIADRLDPERNGTDVEVTGLLVSDNAGTFGEWDKVISTAKKNCELDPINPQSWRRVGMGYIFAGQPDQAIPYLKKALEMNPYYDDAWLMLGSAYLDLGQFEMALEASDHVRDQEIPRFASLRCRTYYAMGNRAQSDLYLDRLLKTDSLADNSYVLVHIYAQRKNADKAFEWLEKEYDRKHPALSIFIGTSRELKALNDPRYNEFLKKMNLSTE